MEREIAEIIKGFRQDSIEIEMNQEHVHKWISQFSPDTQNIILEETLHILKEWYFPKDKINLFLDKMMDYLKSENENATDEEPMKDIYFWNIQESGKSQSQLVEMLNDRVNQKYAIYATKADFLVTMDRRFAKKCKAVYNFLGVRTSVIFCKQNEVVNVLENIVTESDVI